ncbi:hypothetical protein ADK60_09610 [Streptomyces sp. XY431]|nr:hypothetical protein ADK60_09610 [Streptomyces sp. XY431]
MLQHGPFALLLVEVSSCPCTFDHEEYLVSTIHWTEMNTPRSDHWHSESATPPPGRVIGADDRTKAAPTSAVEQGVYDPGSSMLGGCLLQRPAGRSRYGRLFAGEFA